MAAATKIPFPRQTAPYRRIYLPGEDVYRGPDSLYFRQGQSYTTWLINDFTMVVGVDDRWHAYGIRTSSRKTGCTPCCIWHRWTGVNGIDFASIAFMFMHIVFAFEKGETAYETDTDRCYGPWWTGRCVLGPLCLPL